MQPVEGAQSADLSGKAQGRGAYVCKNMDCLRLAMKNKSIRLTPEVAQALEEEIQKDGVEQRAKTMIGFAAVSARQCVAGATAVESAIRGRKAKLVLLDKDCAENTKKGYQNLCVTL